MQGCQHLTTYRRDQSGQSVPPVGKMQNCRTERWRSTRAGAVDSLKSNRRPLTSRVLLVLVMGVPGHDPDHAAQRQKTELK